MNPSRVTHHYCRPRRLESHDDTTTVADREKVYVVASSGDRPRNQRARAAALFRERPAKMRWPADGRHVGRTRGAGNVDKSSGTRVKRKKRYPRRDRYHARGYGAGFMAGDFLRTERNAGERVAGRVSQGERERGREKARRRSGKSSRPVGRHENNVADDECCQSYEP